MTRKISWAADRGAGGKWQSTGGTFDLARIFWQLAPIFGVKSLLRFGAGRPAAEFSNHG